MHSCNIDVTYSKIDSQKRKNFLFIYPAIHSIGFYVTKNRLKTQFLFTNLKNSTYKREYFKKTELNWLRMQELLHFFPDRKAVELFRVKRFNFQTGPMFRCTKEPRKIIKNEKKNSMDFTLQLYSTSDFVNIHHFYEISGFRKQYFDIIVLNSDHVFSWKLVNLKYVKRLKITDCSRYVCMESFIVKVPVPLARLLLFRVEKFLWVVQGQTFPSGRSERMKRSVGCAAEKSLIQYQKT